MKRKTKKKQKKKADIDGIRQSSTFRSSPKPSRHSRNQSLPYEQHQYFHPSPRASPVPHLSRQDNLSDQQQQITTRLLFDNPNALPYNDDDDNDNEARNLNMMSFRRYSYAEEMLHPKLLPIGEHLQPYQHSAENIRPNNSNANNVNTRHGVMVSQTNIPPDMVENAYNLNSRSNQVTKRESLPKNLQDLDISIRDEFEQIKRQYQKKGDPRLSVINSNNVNKSKHSPKTSKKSGSYHGSSCSSNGEDSICKADQASFRPSPCPPPGFLAFQNQHAQPATGKLSNAARVATEVFKEYSFDLDNHPAGKDDVDMDDINGKRCRKHVIILLLVMLVVLVAATVAVLTLTLGVSLTKSKLDSHLLLNSVTFSSAWICSEHDLLKMSVLLVHLLCFMGFSF